MLHQEGHFAALVLLSADDVEKRRCDGAEGFPHCDPQLDWHCDRDEENQTSNQLTVIIINANILCKLIDIYIYCSPQRNPPKEDIRHLRNEKVPQQARHKS